MPAHLSPLPVQDLPLSSHPDIGPEWKSQRRGNSISFKSHLLLRTIYRLLTLHTRTVPYTVIASFHLTPTPLTPSMSST